MLLQIQLKDVVTEYHSFFIYYFVCHILLYNKTVRSFRFLRLRVFAFTQASVLPTGLRCTLTELRCPSGLCYTLIHGDILLLDHDISSMEQYLCERHIKSSWSPYCTRYAAVSMPDCLTIPHLIYYGILKCHLLNPHQNDQGWKGPCFFQRLIAKMS